MRFVVRPSEDNTHWVLRDKDSDRYCPVWFKDENLSAPTVMWHVLMAVNTICGPDQEHTALNE